MRPTSRDLSVSPVLHAMRASTSELHVALEKRLPFFSDSLDATVFLQLMEAYYGFYSPLEQALLDSGAVPADFDLRPLLKTPTLRSDLCALGVSAEALDNLPVCSQLPVIDSVAAFFGVMYVLEGATLGGQVLRREVFRRLQLDASKGAAFLDVYGADTGRRWRQFLGYLASHPLDEAGNHAAGLAAQSTFRCFEGWLEGRKVLL